VVLLANAENLLDLGRKARVRIIYLLRVKFFHFFSGDKAALMAEPLLSQVLAAVVAHLFLCAAHLFLKPVLADLGEDGFLPHHCDIADCSFRALRRGLWPSGRLVCI